jgi:hypothetical protein
MQFMSAGLLFVVARRQVRDDSYLQTAKEVDGSVVLVDHTRSYYSCAAVLLSAATIA